MWWWKYFRCGSTTFTLKYINKFSDKCKSAVKGFWSQSSAPLTCFQHPTIFSSFYCAFSLGLFLSFINFIIWDVFRLLVRQSRRLSATVGRQTNDLRCQNFKSVARRKGPDVFAIPSTWSYCIVGMLCFIPTPSDTDKCLLAGLHARKRCLCPRHCESDDTTAHFTLWTAAVVIMHYQTCLFSAYIDVKTFYYHEFKDKKAPQIFRPAVVAKTALACQC